MDFQETPDLEFSETIEPEFKANDCEETPNLVFTEEVPATEEDEIDDLDEPDQYVESANDDVDEQIINGHDTGLHHTCSTHQKSFFYIIFNFSYCPMFSDVRNGVGKGSHDNRLTQLPLARIKHLMKADPDVTLIQNECAFLVAKATELFIASLARESFVHTAQAKKKTVQKRDVDLAIANVDALVFLEGTMNF